MVRSLDASPSHMRISELLGVHRSLAATGPPPTEARPPSRPRQADGRAVARRLRPVAGAARSSCTDHSKSPFSRESEELAAGDFVNDISGTSAIAKVQFVSTTTAELEARSLAIRRFGGAE